MTNQTLRAWKTINFDWLLTAFNGISHINVSSDYIHSKETYWWPFWKKCWIHMRCNRRLGEWWNHACQESINTSQVHQRGDSWSNQYWFWITADCFWTQYLWCTGLWWIECQVSWIEKKKTLNRPYAKMDAFILFFCSYLN